jgi:vitamin B12 transporter
MANSGSWQAQADSSSWQVAVHENHALKYSALYMGHGSALIARCARALVAHYSGESQSTEADSSKNENKVKRNSMSNHGQRPKSCFKRASLLCGLLSGAAPIVNAQVENSSPLEEIIVVSSRVPLPLVRVGTSVAVLDATAIQAHGNLVLTEVLRQLPSVAASSPGGAGQASSLRIRGEEGYRTLTILDGMRLSDPSGTQIGPQLEHLLSSGISRVEILRGPQGLAYGADAGGVINIGTRQVEQGSTFLFDSQQGAFASRQHSLGVGSRGAAGDFFVAFSDYATDGFNAQASDSVLRDNDGYANSTLHARGSVRVADSVSLEAVHRRVQGDAESDACFAATIVHQCRGLFGMEATRVGINYKGPAVTHTLSYSNTATDRDYLAEEVSNYLSAGDLQRWEYQGTTSQLGRVDLVFGADQESDLNNGQGRDNKGVYIEALGTITGALHMTVGLRYDDNEDFGTNTSYRVSGSWLFAETAQQTLRFRGSIGTGFRAPSPFEIAYNKGPFAAPPASQLALRQETSAGWELGADYLWADLLRLETVYFDQQVEDAIIFDLNSYSGYLQEFGHSFSRGIEIGSELVVGSQWSILANYTRNYTGRPNGMQRLRRPAQLGNLGVSWHGLEQRLDLNAFLRASRGSIDESAGSVQALEDFAVLDLGAQLRVNKNLELYARLENAMDRQYQEVLDYQSAGRAAYVGFRFNLSSEIR